MAFEIQKNVSLAAKTTFKLGGPAEYYCEINTLADLNDVWGVIQKKGCPWYVLAAGSNLLIADQGVAGFVLKLNFKEYQVDTDKLELRVGASLLLPYLVNKLKTANLTGLDFLIAIPGSVGGAIYGNAGCYGYEIKDVLISCQVWSQGVVSTYSNLDCQFGYRDSIFKKNKGLIVSALFKVLDLETKREDPAEYLLKKQQDQPLGTFAAGSIFKNVCLSSQATSFKKLRQRAGSAWDLIYKDGYLSAWWLIDQVGLRGYQIGGAQFSKKHCNYIVNSGQASSADIVSLIKQAQILVWEEFSLKLEPEIQLLGF